MFYSFHYKLPNIRDELRKDRPAEPTKLKKFTSCLGTVKVTESVRSLWTEKGMRGPITFCASRGRFVEESKRPGHEFMTTKWGLVWVILWKNEKRGRSERHLIPRPLKKEKIITFPCTRKVYLRSNIRIYSRSFLSTKLLTL